MLFETSGLQAKELAIVGLLRLKDGVDLELDGSKEEKEHGSRVLLYGPKADRTEAERQVFGQLLGRVQVGY